MSQGRVSVLVVGGDAALRGTIRTALGPTGFVFEEARSGVEAVARILRGSYNLALIGVDEGTSAAFETCSRLRGIAPDLGLVLVGPGSSMQDEIHALEAGADDCVSVPIRFREVVERLRAVLQRPRMGPGRSDAILDAGNLRLDTAGRTFWRAGDKIRLSPREFDLLAVLMKHPDCALTHVKLLVAVWGPEVKHDADYLRTYIKTLRRKVETDPARPEYIVTVPWLGYKFCNP